MRLVRIVILSFLCSMYAQAQFVESNMTSDLSTGKHREPYRTGFSLSPYSVAASVWSSPGDTVRHNMYGDLGDDNPEYNQRSPWWVCAIRVTANNVVTWMFDRYIFNADFARIGINSWTHNLKSGFEWDTDRFGMNYFFHPYSGAGYFNASRSNGYDFFESVPFAFATAAPTPSTI